MRTIVVIMITVYLTAGFYLGAGCIGRIEVEEKLDLLETTREKLSKDSLELQYHGYEVHNEYELQRAVILEDLERFKWARDLNNLVAVMVAASSFGLIGGVISLFVAIVLENRQLEELKIFSHPVLSALTGIVVVATVYLVPAILVKGERGIEPYALMFISLFTGIFTKEFYVFLSTRVIKKILKNED